MITEIGRTGRTFSDVAGRVEPLPSDIVMAFVDLGISINGMNDFTFRPFKQSLPAPVPTPPQKPLSLLSAGSKQHLPPYIPNHLPQFPDPHAYTRTPVSIEAR